MPNKMKPEIKERWMEALRSGKYTQTAAYLAAKNVDDETQAVTWSYCCLGVLCEVVKNDIDLIVKNPENLTLKLYGKEEATGILPEEVARFAGLDDESPQTEEGICLTEINDEGTPFAEIADILEKEF